MGKEKGDQIKWNLAKMKILFSFLLVSSRKLLPCDHEVMSSGPGNSLAEMQRNVAYIRPKLPKWSDPSLDLGQVGAMCIGLPFFNLFLI